MVGLPCSFGRQSFLLRVIFFGVLQRVPKKHTLQDVIKSQLIKRILFVRRSFGLNHLFHIGELSRGNLLGQPEGALLGELLELSLSKDSSLLVDFNPPKKQENCSK